VKQGVTANDVKLVRVRSAAAQDAGQADQVRLPDGWDVLGPFE
jgi:hypothetical protein